MSRIFRETFVLTFKRVLGIFDARQAYRRWSTVVMATELELHSIAPPRPSSATVTPTTYGTQIDEGSTLKNNTGKIIYAFSQIEKNSLFIPFQFH